VLVEGPPGIGKTAVLAAADAQARGRDLHVLTSVGGELEQDLPFGTPFRWEFARRALESRRRRSARSPHALLGSRSPA
jgi:DNA helicase TIP49 (TBP-interacting protein)